MSKFNVGATVKVINTEANTIAVKREACGKTYTIVKKSDWRDDAWILDVTDQWLFTERELELVEAVIPFEGIKVGDTVKVETTSNGITHSAQITVDRITKTHKNLYNKDGGIVQIPAGATVTLIDRPKIGDVGTVYSYASVVGDFIEYYIVTPRGLVKAVNVGDPHAEIVKIPVSKLTKLPVKQ